MRMSVVKTAHHERLFERNKRLSSPKPLIMSGSPARLPQKNGFVSHSTDFQVFLNCFNKIANENELKMASFGKNAFEATGFYKSYPFSSFQVYYFMQLGRVRILVMRRFLFLAATALAFQTSDFAQTT